MRKAKIREQWGKYVVVEDPALIKADLLAELDARDRASGTVSVFVLQQELKKTKDECVAECVGEIRALRREQASIGSPRTSSWTCAA